MKLIATQTLTSDQPNITFTSIPQNFTDLVLFISARTDRALEGDGFSLRFNGNQSGYSQRRLIGAGSGSPSSDTQLNSFFTTANNATANTFGNSSIYIPNYAGNANKSYSNDGVSENNAATSYAGINAGVWSNTAAINSITLTPEGGTVFRANTTASLYGIGGTGDGWAPKATGGVISKTGGYYVHTFTASGTFTPTESLTNVEYLVVAGGGGGSVPHGGGGAGGYRCSVTGESSGGGASAESKLSLTSGTSYTVTVGAGGAGAGAGTVGFGTSGGNSVFGSITSTGGGAGGRSDADGLTGGSGGGNGYIQTTAVNNGTANQGFRGGASGGNAPPNYPSGGGGGAGSVGQTPTSSSDNGGDGGSGVTSSITGTAMARAGGGAGGNYGNVTGGAAVAGGGNAGNPSNKNGIAGTANTGGGGGGSISSTTGTVDSGAAGAGGSGIVIVRYAA
jgi:hypothetical protein